MSDDDTKMLEEVIQKAYHSYALWKLISGFGGRNNIEQMEKEHGDNHFVLMETIKALIEKEKVSKNG